MTKDNEEIVITEAQLETMFDIARSFQGEMIGVRRSKKHRQRLWRASGIVVDYSPPDKDAAEISWSISPDGKAMTMPTEHSDTGFKRFKWRRLREGE